MGRSLRAGAEVTGIFTRLILIVGQKGCSRQLSHCRSDRGNFTDKAPVRPRRPYVQEDNFRMPDDPAGARPRLGAFRRQKALASLLSPGPRALPTRAAIPCMLSLFRNTSRVNPFAQCESATHGRHRGGLTRKTA